MTRNAHTEVLCGGCFTKIDLGRAYNPVPTKKLDDRTVYFCTFGCEKKWVTKRSVQARLFPQDAVEQIPLSFS